MKKIVSGLMIFLTIFMMMSIFVFPAGAWTVRNTIPTAGSAGWQYYSSPINNYPIGPSGGNCTWYAYGRAYEVWGKDSGLGAAGDAGNWYGYAQKIGLSVGSTPKAGAIICWSTHVGFVESVSGSTVVWTESNYYAGMSPFKKATSSTPSTYCSAYGGYLQGYIYLDGLSSSDITYTTISAGDYYIQNKSTGTYLTVQDGADVNTQNVLVASFKNSNAFKMNISATTTGYKIRPLCCSSRLVNPYADVVVSGKNVNIYDDVKDSSQWWRFESAGSGYYYIRNVQNPSCCLTVSGTDVKVSTYSGSNSQKWYLHPLSYKITYNANGGSGAPSAQTKYHAEKLTLSSTKPTRTGYTFLGWATSSSATSAEYAAGASYTANKKATLYAVWRANKLTVKFHANGGSVSKEGYTLSGDYCATTNGVYTQNWTYNQAKTTGLTNNTTLGLVRPGYSFMGWSPTKSGEIVFNHNDTSIKPTDISTNIQKGDCTVALYAIWEPITIAIQYNANGGSGSMSSHTTENGAFRLKENTFTKTGYTFVGWNAYRVSDGKWYVKDQGWTSESDINKNGYTKKVYPDKTHAGSDAIDTWSTVDNDTLIFYAVWQVNSLWAYYNLNGGSVESDMYCAQDDILCYADGVGIIQMFNYNSDVHENDLFDVETYGIKREGYHFVGWSTDPNGTTIYDPNNETSISITELANDILERDCRITLYAIWEEAVCSGDVNGDGSVNSADAVLLMRVCANANVEYNEANADINESGNLDSSDVVALMKRITTSA